MAAETGISYAYSYPFASSVDRTADGWAVRLATCDARREHPHFFKGFLRRPREIGDLLLGLTEVVRTDFRIPNPDELDPVVTSSEGGLRFEVFSGCAGAYARVDLGEDAFEDAHLEPGTTNVDFNDPMRTALTRLRNDDEARLAVGADAVELESGAGSVVEKKVTLPRRWLKSFGEVQACQLRLERRAELSGSVARRLLRGLPRSGTSKLPAYLEAGATARFTRQPGRDRVRVEGVHRLRLLDSMLGAAERLTVWADDTDGISGWELDTGHGRFFLLLSPGVFRGFSGEGGLLTDLAPGDEAGVLPRVMAQLRWQPRIDAASVARDARCSEQEAATALATLGSRGLVGYDVEAGAYFHRELPFDIEKVDTLQPRLRNARKLIADGRVSRLPAGSSGDVEIAVEGSGVTHRVRLSESGDRCTCPWFSKYQGSRGPCKHVLAARMFVEAS